MQIDPPLVSAVVAIAAAAVSTFSYVLNRGLQPLGAAAKLTDRLYELDRMVLQYPEAMAAFMREANRADAYFYAPETAVPRDATYFRLKALAYYHLNFFEEVYLAIQDETVDEQMEGQGWLDYIVERMRHRLLQEVFDREAGRIYRGKFAAFVRSRAGEIARPCDPAMW